ncbi:connector enhancer of kinase suppressor of ras 1 isoform X2 [Octodon degus]|uniref:Connector enhancer of kinase suppressor of ras 1 isoform X2 n=1 Tax=Octodon degus TaxID=10160 RepID=A0A6P6DFI9_OCTDE|nr:connector enhancer of kinase suppressor of ras 1 isoform X2 [Octodon degus]
MGAQGLLLSGREAQKGGQPGEGDCPKAEKKSKVLRICSHVSGICHNILNCTPEELLEQKAVLQEVQLHDPSGLKIQTTSNCLHFVSCVGTQVSTDPQLQILPGDEVVQINEQVVVGWPHKNVVKELLGHPTGARVSLVLKKIPVPETPPQTPLDSPHLRSQSLAMSPLSSRVPSEEGFAFNPTSDPSPAPSPAWTDSTSLEHEPLPTAPASPATFPAGAAETPWSPGHPNKHSPLGRKKSKGMATKLSRRRVSCRELGRPDCDGWLLLRKTPGGFMGPRWRRCWFVLKGHTLYWYCQPQDEKAQGLINISNYSLESGHDQKKKYVFQLTHEVYKPFVFAADTLSDLSMWVRHLITCISKYQSPGQTPSAREEDCYSETEAEDHDDEAGSRSASPNPAQTWSPLLGDTSPSGSVMTQRSPRASLAALTDGSEGALEGMVQGLRQGGVSFLGRPQPLTQEQWRSSFMRRNRDPHLNERAHRVRALQSTLKAKMQELQALDEVLGDPELTAEKFRRWKEQNQELYSECLGAWGVVPADGSSQAQTSGSTQHSPLPSGPQEPSHVCPLTPENNLQPPDL